MLVMMNADKKGPTKEAMAIAAEIPIGPRNDGRPAPSSESAKGTQRSHEKA